MKFVFLYTEIAEYFLACCKELSKHGQIHIIRWPINKEAPFQFAGAPFFLGGILMLSSALIAYFSFKGKSFL